MQIIFGNQIINLNKELSTNLSYSGVITEDTVLSNDFGVGALLYLTETGFSEAMADSSLTVPCRGLALESGAGIRKILLNGFFRDNSLSLTKGLDIYVSNLISGAITQVAPSGDLEQVQPIGWAIDTNIIYFNPSLLVIEVKTT